MLVNFSVLTSGIFIVFLSRVLTLINKLIRYNIKVLVDVRRNAFSMKKGFNNVDARGININVNNQKNLSTNIQYSRQEISSYKIPGRSKASICNSKLFPSTGGINSTLADACQKDASIQSTYHTGSQPYMNDYVLKQIENDPSIFWDNYDE